MVISASHNPVEFNGIKFFNHLGYKLSDEREERIENIILDNAEKIVLPIGNDIGKKRIINNGGDIYIDFLKKSMDKDFKGLKIAMDCANGAAYQVAPKLFK